MFGGLECVAADLDGTLLGPDGLPGKADRAAVRALSAAGIRVVAVTGGIPTSRSGRSVSRDAIPPPSV